jgi:butyrate response factor 1
MKSSKKSPKSANKKSSINVSTSNNNQDDSEKKQKSLYKTELCRNWEETNHCRYGMKCQYAHGAADLRELDRHPKYKTQKCRTFHQTGSCPYGARCTFRHFNLPGDALEMKNLEKEEEEKRQNDEAVVVAAAAAASAAAAAASVIAKNSTIEKQETIDMKQEDCPSIFSAENKKALQQNWFLDNNSMSPLNGLVTENNTFLKRNMMMNQFNNSFDPEDSLLPSNAESLLPHQLLFDLESPEEEEEPARCPLRNYVNLPSFSNFQVPHYLPHNHPQQQQQQQQGCKTFFRPWLF